MLLYFGWCSTCLGPVSEAATRTFTPRRADPGRTYASFSHWAPMIHVISRRRKSGPNLPKFGMVYWIYHGLLHYLRPIMLCFQVHGIGCTEKKLSLLLLCHTISRTKRWFLVETPRKITSFWVFLLESVLHKLFLVDFHWRNPSKWQMDSHLCAQVLSQCQAETTAESDFCSVKAPSPKNRTILEHWRWLITTTSLQSVLAIVSIGGLIPEENIPSSYLT